MVIRVETVRHLEPPPPPPRRVTPMAPANYSRFADSPCINSSRFNAGGGAREEEEVFVHEVSEAVHRRSSDSLAFTRRNSFTRQDLRRPRHRPAFQMDSEAHLSAMSMSREIIVHRGIEQHFRLAGIFKGRKNYRRLPTLLLFDRVVIVSRFFFLLSSSLFTFCLIIFKFYSVRGFRDLDFADLEIVKG